MASTAAGSRPVGKDGTADPASDPDRSLRGFAGGIAGAFYGPAGEELGGIIGGGRDAVGSSPAWHVMGFIGGERASDE